jgi:hypothetical protein
MIDFVLGWIDNFYSNATGRFFPRGTEDSFQGDFLRGYGRSSGTFLLSPYANVKHNTDG